MSPDAWKAALALPQKGVEGGEGGGGGAELGGGGGFDGGSGGCGR